jgi:hypothetical protein
MSLKIDQLQTCQNLPLGIQIKAIAKRVLIKYKICFQTSSLEEERFLIFSSLLGKGLGLRYILQQGTGNRE